MRSTNNPRADDFSWDGSHKNHRPGRALRVAPDSRTKLLRAAQTDRCATCGNPVEWYPRPGGRAVPLHPRELPAASIPPAERWNITAGLAQPGHDGTPWCRIRHHALCSATPTSNRSPLLDGLRRDLALNTRRLKDAGAFTLCRDLPPPGPDPAPALPARPVVHLFYLRYLAPGPLETIRCVAQTRTRRRCTRPVLDPEALPGTWTLLPAGPRPAGRDQLPLTDALMAVYDLTGLPYSEQLRWRAQRCTTHALTPEAADAALPDWEPFNARLHHQHIHHEIPDPQPHHR